MTTSLNPFPKGFLKETFLGPKKKTNRDLSCEERVDEYLADRLQDIKEFAQEGFSSDDFFEYGLCVDYVEPFTFGDDQDEGYLRYQLSWGGPSDEFRFYQLRTEYWFLDWHDGASRDVSQEDDITELKSFFNDCGYFDPGFEGASSL